MSPMQRAIAAALRRLIARFPLGGWGLLLLAVYYALALAVLAAAGS